MEAFVEKFHNIGGNTKSEHQRNFNSYMSEVAESSDINTDDLVTAIEPKTPQEEIFYVHLLIALDKHAALLSALSRGNKLISKVVLKRADVGKLFQNVTGDEFVKRVCPEISYVTRLKLINKLAQSSGVDHADYFSAVNKTYGIVSAKALAINCSVEVLRDVITNTNVVFSERELLKLPRNLLPEYFQQRNAKFSSSGRLAKQLVFEDLPTFHALVKFGFPKIGRRGLVRYVSAYKKEFFEDPTTISRYSVLYKCLSFEEYVGLFKHLLPKDVAAFPQKAYELVSYFKLLPREKRGEVLFTNYQAKYGVQTYPKAEYAFESLLELLALEDRLKFDLTEYEQMLSTEVSIPLLKSRINSTSDAPSRSVLLGKLVKTCKINDDLPALKEVLKYFNARHKNESHAVRDSFMGSVMYSFPFERFDAEAWESVSEAVRVFTVNGEFFNGINVYLEREIYTGYHSGADFREDLKRFVKDTGIYCPWNVLTKHPAIEKDCILKCYDLLSECFDGEDLDQAEMEFFSTVDEWNKRHPKDKLSYLRFPRTIKIVMDTFYSKYYIIWLIRRVILLTPENEAEEEIRREVMEYVLNTRRDYIGKELAVWLLRHDPARVALHPEVFLDESVVSTEFAQLAAKLVYLDVYASLVKASLEIVRNPRDHPLTINGAFMFLSLIPEYFPAVEDYLTSSGDFKKNLQCLKLHDDPQNNLKIVLRYSNDPTYSNVMVGAIYHTLHRLPQKSIPSVISELAKIKLHHGIALAGILGTKEYSSGVIRKAWDEIADGDFLLKHTLTTSFHDRDAWELFLTQLPKASRVPRPNLKKAPKALILPIVTALWKRDSNDLLKYLTPEVFDFSSDNQIIDDCLSYENPEPNPAVVSFVYNSLIFSGSRLLERADRLANSNLIKPICLLAIQEKPHANAIATLHTDDFPARVFLELTQQFVCNRFINLELFLVTQLQILIAQYGVVIAFLHRKVVRDFFEALPEDVRKEGCEVPRKLLRFSDDDRVLGLALELFGLWEGKLTEEDYSALDGVAVGASGLGGVFLSQFVRCL